MIRFSVWGFLSCVFSPSALLHLAKMASENTKAR